VIKPGNTPLELNEADIVAISYITAKVARRLRKIKRTCQSSKTLAQKVLNQLENKKYMAATFFMYNFNNMDANIFYKPSEIKMEINKYMQTNTADDTTDMALASDCDTLYVTSKDISKTLRTLENQIGLHKETTKIGVKSNKGKQKIKFLGKPYFYKLPHGSERLKKIMSNPVAVQIVFKSLVELGLLDHLQFLLEGYFYIVRDADKGEKVYDLARIGLKIAEGTDTNTRVDKQGFESFRTFVRSLSEKQLKILASKIAEVLGQYPNLFRGMLLFALSKNL
jgi:hypothetical protein